MNEEKRRRNGIGARKRIAVVVKGGRTGRGRESGDGVNARSEKGRAEISWPGEMQQ